jgi:hypothetical protein
VALLALFDASVEAVEALVAAAFFETNEAASLVAVLVSAVSAAVLAVSAAA